MKRALRLLVPLALCTFWVLFLHPSAALGGVPEEVNSGTLLQEWERYDGQEVVFRGEVVGDVMVRGEHAWVTVNDDHYSLNALHEAGELRGATAASGYGCRRRRRRRSVAWEGTAAWGIRWRYAASSTPTAPSTAATLTSTPRP
ncbi:hypothetical protein [Candidatus Solincola sp.]|nr:hypothetical protein [Actinomycetota bacterium]MDI7251176.1 hypothetical protein [Actinomycetota bacterium]